MTRKPHRSNFSNIFVEANLQSDFSVQQTELQKSHFEIFLFVSFQIVSTMCVIVRNSLSNIHDPTFIPIINL